jgi:hypothetical protein
MIGEHDTLPWLISFSLSLMPVVLVVNWEAVSAIGQVIGALAVVLSLIYLASEVRSNARATRLASMRSLSEKVTGTHYPKTQSPVGFNTLSFEI